jgi:hypothetical protein
LIRSLRDEHLTAVQEFLALGRWRRPASVVPHFQATNNGKDVDWKFETDGTTVLLEVKFRRTDWRRGHPETVKFNFANLFEEIDAKLPGSRPGLLRVAHVVLVQPPDRALLVAAKKFSQSPAVDAVIIESINVGEVEVLGREAERVRPEIGRAREFPRPDIIPIVFARPSIRPDAPA